jgi:hypothetical protein
MWRSQLGGTTSTSGREQPSGASTSHHVLATSHSRPVMQGCSIASAGRTGQSAAAVGGVGTWQQQQPWPQVNNRPPVNSGAAAGSNTRGGTRSSATVVALHLDCSRALSWLDGVPDAAWGALLQGTQSVSGAGAQVRPGGEGRRLQAQVRGVQIRC